MYDKPYVVPIVKNSGLKSINNSSFCINLINIYVI